MVYVQLVVLCFVSVHCSLIPKQQKFFDIDKNGLRQYWELISWQGLIKAKVKTILPDLPHVDTVLYNLCSQEDGSLVALAKCAVTVLEKRDKLRVQNSTFMKKRRKIFRTKRIKFSEKIPKKFISLTELKEADADRRRRTKLKRIVYRITLMRKPRRRRRLKRAQPTPYIDALDSLKEHFRKHEIVKSYYGLIDRENSRLYQELGINTKKEEKKDDFEESMQEILRTLNSFTGSNDTSLSFLSPRLFSILPGSSGSLFSPDILSFYDKGLVSIPKMIEVVTGKGTNQKMILEWVLKVSGAGHQLMSKQYEIAETASFHYPLVRKMSRNDYNWLQAKKTFTPRQNLEMKEVGFTYLTKKQQGIIFKDSGRQVATNVTTRREKELWLENKIKDIADLDPTRSRRRKRQEGAADDGLTTLVPVAFTNMINEGVALELITLSPQAFVTAIQSPEALAVYTLSPQAFLAAILSPVALVVRLLSPTAFALEILSPRAFTPYILTPRAFLIEILTPRAFEPHIASPDVMVLDILSPAGLSPQVLSPEMGAIIVLSPKFLSPRVASAEKFLVEILSPHILGGPHTSHDETVISIGGGEHSHDHKPGDEGTAAHQEDIHVHEGPLEEEHAHEQGYNPFGFTLVPTIPPKDDYFQINDLINPTVPPDGDVLGFKYLPKYFNGDALQSLQTATLPSNFLG